MGKIINRFKPLNIKRVAVLMFVAFAFLFTVSLTLGQKFDYDIWFHYRAGKYFFDNGVAPTVPIDSWYAMSQNIYWVSHEWLFGVMVYVLMNISPYLVNILPTFMLSGIVALVAYYNRKLFVENPPVAFLSIMVLSMVIKMGNTPRPHLFAYLFTFLLFVILRKDAENKGNIVYWLMPLTVVWVNMHGGSYILLFVFLAFSILTSLFDFELGKITFTKAPAKHQIKRLIVFVVSFALVGLNAHGSRMYIYPLTNFADNLMQSNISEWGAPDLKVAWQIWIYVAAALYVCALIATRKKIKVIDMITGFAYLYLTLRSIRFAPQMAIIGVMVIGQYADSLDFVKPFANRLLLLFASMMLFISSISVIPEASIYLSREPFSYHNFPSDEMIELIKEIAPERLYNPYDAGGYLTYRGVMVFVDGRADIYTYHNLADALSLNRGSSAYMDYIRKYDFDYMLVFKGSVLDTYLGLNNGDIFENVATDNKYVLYKVELTD